MRKILIIAAVLVCAAGCGKKNTADNSVIQSPNDQPIGAPKPMDGHGGPAAPAIKGAGGGKPLPKVDLKP